MKKAIITGACGLVGSSAVKQLSNEGFEIIGIDNDSRKMMFGEHASTADVGEKLKSLYPNFTLINADIRNFEEIEEIFKKHSDAVLIEHLAAAPAHEWATKNTIADFHINATGTMNMLENYRQHIPDAVFIQCSTSKVYGDIVNNYPYEILETRYDLPKDHKYYKGFDEEIGYLDNNLRSLFGASKCCGDIMAHEFGKYFGLKIAIFRPACISGSNHKGDKLHGFLAYLAKCIATGELYTINGYDGLQTRDTIHADDLVTAFYEVFKDPTFSYGEAYNMGAGRDSTISMRDAIEMIETILGKKGNIGYSEIIRKGDHICNTFSTEKFKRNYPNWNTTFNNQTILEEICKQYL
jgi:CDP-paratose 2-epimerase